MVHKWSLGFFVNRFGLGAARRQNWAFWKISKNDVQLHAFKLMHTMSPTLSVCIVCIFAAFSILQCTYVGIGLYSDIRGFLLRWDFWVNNKYFQQTYIQRIVDCDFGYN